MAAINLLDSSVYNRIAAGEVVERPYSVVKELVENALDAGATRISIEIRDGGIGSIKVTDDGEGIAKSELKKALLPHATSKIAKVEDLDTIATLGFRGEALASIASVSKIRIASKPLGQECGAAIYAEGGKMQDPEEYPIPAGTEITVNQLFFNTPARAKFLKTPKSEESEISNIITRFILGNPAVCFRYIADGKTVYQSFGGSAEDALIGIYGAQIVNQCYAIDTVKNGIRLSGYLGKQHFTKPNRTYQTLFINGRYVVNSTVSSAIMNAYGSYLMKRQYPFYVLSLQIPAEEIDVNVHPNKTDVRFANNQIVYGAVYSVVSKVLDGLSEALQIIKPQPEDSSPEPIKLENHQDFQEKIKYDYGRHNNQGTGSFVATFCDHESLKEEHPKQKTSDDKIFLENKKFIQELERAEKEQAKMPAVKAVPDTKQENFGIDEEIIVIGQALNTYIIFEKGDSIYFIDQHAAHERLLYDRFCRRVAEKELTIQPLLAPYILNINHQEYAFLSAEIPILNDLGIEIEEFGHQAFKVSSLPSELTGMNFGAFFEEIFGEMNTLKSITLTDLLKERLAQAACKAAIKAGDPLSKDDMKELLKMLNGNMGLKCPHGRPIAVKITRTEIDKWFKRIV